MKLINNITDLFGDDLKQTLSSGAHLKIAASCFSIYAFEALKDELEKIESFEFIFTSPIFIPNDSLDKLRKERREFYIPSPDHVARHTSFLFSLSVTVLKDAGVTFAVSLALASFDSLALFFQMLVAAEFFLRKRSVFSTPRLTIAFASNVSAPVLIFVFVYDFPAPSILTLAV